MSFVTESTNSPLGMTPFQNNDTICLVGDSITHSGTYHSHIFLYHSTRHPLMRLRFVNCGISGDSASGMLGRLNQDVFSNNPTVVTLSAGMNDVGRDLYSLIKAPDDAENEKRSIHSNKTSKESPTLSPKRV